MELPIKQVTVILLQFLGESFEMENIQEFDETQWEMNKDLVLSLRQKLEACEVPYFCFPEKRRLKVLYARKRRKSRRAV